MTTATAALGLKVATRVSVTHARAGRGRPRGPSRRAELRRLVAEGADVRDVVARLRGPDRNLLERHLGGVSHRKIAKALGFKCHHSITQHLRRPEVAYLKARFIAAQYAAFVGAFVRGDFEARPILLMSLASPTLDAQIALVLRCARYRWS